MHTIESIVYLYKGIYEFFGEDKALHILKSLGFHEEPNLYEERAWYDKNCVDRMFAAMFNPDELNIFEQNAELPKNYIVFLIRDFIQKTITHFPHRRHMIDRIFECSLLGDQILFELIKGPFKGITIRDYDLCIDSTNIVWAYYGARVNHIHSYLTEDRRSCFIPIPDNVHVINGVLFYLYKIKNIKLE